MECSLQGLQFRARAVLIVLKNAERCRDGRDAGGESRCVWAEWASVAVVVQREARSTAD